jgi:hypothetical protein
MCDGLTLFFLSKRVLLYDEYIVSGFITLKIADFRSQNIHFINMHIDSVMVIFVGATSFNS